MGFPPKRARPFPPDEGTDDDAEPAGPGGLRADALAGRPNGRGHSPRGAFDEAGDFKAFNPTFVSLLGRGRKLRRVDMQAFADFAPTIHCPPSPIRELSSVPTPLEVTGQQAFRTVGSTRGAACDECHSAIDLAFLGTNGRSVNPTLPAPQQFKIPHLRNHYQKVGMFGVAGPQVRGFGFLHDRSMPTIPDFLRAGMFALPDQTTIDAVGVFLLGFDTGLGPKIGRQEQDDQDLPYGGPSDLLGGCAHDGGAVVIKTVISGEARGSVHFPGPLDFQSDRRSEAPMSLDTLSERARTSGQAQVYTCVLAGSGIRIGVDRDEDGVFDGDERDAGTDPADPSNHP